MILCSEENAYAKEKKTFKRFGDKILGVGSWGI